MKELEFYKEYEDYLNWRLDENKINKGKYCLLKISKSEYNKFVNRLENDIEFNNKIIEIIKINKRNDDISEILSKDIVEDVDDDFFDDLYI